MRRIASASLIIVAALLAQLACSRAEPRPRIEVWEEVLSKAETVGFDYEGALDRAAAGDLEGLRRVMEFSRHTDAAASLGHSYVLIELLHRVGDNTFADAARRVAVSDRKRVWDLLEGAGLEWHGEDFAAHMPAIYVQTYRVLIEAAD